MSIIRIVAPSMTMIKSLVVLSFLAGAALGITFKIYSLVPAVLILIVVMFAVGQLEHLTTSSILLASASAAFACQIGYVITSRTRSWMLDRARPRAREINTTRDDRKS